MEASRLLLFGGVLCCLLIVTNLICVVVLVTRTNGIEAKQDDHDLLVVSIAEIQKEAERKMDAMPWHYLEETAGTGQTHRDNMAAFQHYKFLPRLLTGLNNATTKTTILGRQVSCPIGLAPIGFQGLVNPKAEKAIARAAAQKEVVGAFSIVSTYSLEEITAAAPSGVHWQQIDLFKDRGVGLDLIRRTERQGFSALVVCVDFDHGLAVRYLSEKYITTVLSGMKKGNFPRERPLPEKYSTNPGQSWDDLAWAINTTSLPVVVKGILRPEDAVTAVDLGASAIWVSNHGGRSLDGVPASIDVMKDIVEAVDGRAEVYMDGGLRTGMDVAKAIALGAQAVFIGRPMSYGLAYNGQEGVEKVLEILQKEFYSTMVLLGADTPDNLDSSFISKS